MLNSHNKKSKAFLGNIKVKKIYKGTERVYSAGNMVTYYIDTDKTPITEEVDSGASCLSIDFTPTKSGWDFVGWRKDKVASESILTTEIMGDEPITLYAVFKQKITLSYSGNGATGGSVTPETKDRFYNYGTYANPIFTLKSNSFTRSGYTFNGWDLGTAGAKVTLSANATATAKWTDNAWTWVNNYVGSGAGLTISITDARNCASLSSGETLSRFDIHSYHDDDTNWMSIDFQTNRVNTKGCKYMTLTFPDFYMGRNNDGNSGDYVRVMSTSSSTPLKEWKDRVYGGSQTIDVSSASEVYIIGCIGAWGQSQSPNARVQAISFSN